MGRLMQFGKKMRDKASYFAPDLLDPIYEVSTLRLN